MVGISGEAIGAGVFTNPSFSVVTGRAGRVAKAKSHYICGRTRTKVRCTIESEFCGLPRYSCTQSITRARKRSPLDGRQRTLSSGND